MLYRSWPQKLDELKFESTSKIEISVSLSSNVREKVIADMISYTLNQTFNIFPILFWHSFHKSSIETWHVGYQEDVIYLSIPNYHYSLIPLQWGWRVEEKLLGRDLLKSSSCHSVVAQLIRIMSSFCGKYGGSHPFLSGW